MTQITIGGVPEHFNLPWHLAQSNKAFEKQNIDLKWIDYPGGTGDMCEALRTGDIDVAIILTEGIIKDIVNGNPSKIIQTYVQSPLVWGIHVAHDSSYRTVDDLKGTTAAISRMGSGSHLMAYINAEQNDWDIETDLKFNTIQNIEGALHGFENGTVDYFLWEKFMTKPFVDSGQLRRIGNCLSPWPCFVIAANQNMIEREPEALKDLLRIINEHSQDFKSIDHIEKVISESYNLEIEDVEDWLKITEWSQSLLDEPTIQKAQKHLYKLKIIPEIFEYEALTASL
ncbi:substrate-binding domain-containing protein [Gaetbulibacter aestuarii]|uniref:Substrate-binding domain-containing protein n=1 Tax=Gaetbulibacter aestuarii TaxID=1502358 RepID=A0ABW7N0L3_9FLAO